MLDDGIVCFDNGMYKIWFVCNYCMYVVNILLFDNVLVMMGVGLLLVMMVVMLYLQCCVMVVCGDGGFMMNLQEMEIVVWLGFNLVVVIFNDSVYGMICWKQVVDGFEDFGMWFGNLDFVKYVEVYGVKGFWVIVVDQLVLMIEVVFVGGGVYVVDVLIDYFENICVLVDELCNCMLVVGCVQVCFFFGKEFNMLIVVQVFDCVFIVEIGVDSVVVLGCKFSVVEWVFKDCDGWFYFYQCVVILCRFVVLMDVRCEYLVLQIVCEGGKLLLDVIVEIICVIDGVYNVVDELCNFVGCEILMGLLVVVENCWVFIIWEFIGIVVVILVFNYLLNLIVYQVVLVIVVGCLVIIKLVFLILLLCLEFVVMVYEVGLFELWCQSFLLEGNDLVEVFVMDRCIVFLSFIGLVRVGWLLYVKFVYGVCVVLEYGGVVLVIVDCSVDLFGIIELIVKGGYYYVGQVCVFMQCIFVYDVIVEDFIQVLIVWVECFCIGDLMFQIIEVGLLIQLCEVDCVVEWIDEVVCGGVQLVVGGRWFFDIILQFIVLFNLFGDVWIIMQEVFGLVVVVYCYVGLDEVIVCVNVLFIVFQVSVFVQDIDIVLCVVNWLDVLVVMINDFIVFCIDWMFFVGCCELGYGIGGILYIMWDMLQEKMILMWWC